MRKMMNLNVLSMTGLAVLALTACVEDRHAAPPPSSVGALPTSAPSSPPLTVTQDQALLAGNTITGMAENGQPYYAYFTTSGAIHLRMGSVDDSGTWRTATDGRVCTLYRRVGGGAEHCYAFYQLGQQIAFFEPSGNYGGAFTVLNGNPQNL
jgi:hypothetical protein